KRELARAISIDAASVDDHALNGGALPMFSPPCDVVAIDVGFGDVRLRPSQRASIPRWWWISSLSRCWIGARQQTDGRDGDGRRGEKLTPGRMGRFHPANVITELCTSTG